MKIAEIRERTDEELRLLSAQLRDEYLALRVKQATNQLEDTSTLRRLRLDIARVETTKTARSKGLEAKKADV